MMMMMIIIIVIIIINISIHKKFIPHLTDYMDMPDCCIF